MIPVEAERRKSLSADRAMLDRGETKWLKKEKQQRRRKEIEKARAAATNKKLREETSPSEPKRASLHERRG